MDNTPPDDFTIRIKTKFVKKLKLLCMTDNILSSLCFHDFDQPQTSDEAFCYFRVSPAEGVSKYNSSEIQAYVDSLCEAESEHWSKSGDEATGEDSSYDSDYDGSEDQPRHGDVSRTVSDTLAQEYSEYVADPAYLARLEFALKLGYTEKLVQAALVKLGPNPEQNELLAELIKLGAQQQSNSKLKPGQESLHNSSENIFYDQYFSSDMKLRPIVIDGSNVAMSHGNKTVFSCRGIKICVDWFRARGHTEITVFVPKWRKEAPRPDNPVVDQDILNDLEKERLLVFTPSREIRGKRMVCYDDRYILKLATDNDGIVVSNDNYRDLVQECPEFRKVVEERILMYSFVSDRFMPPDDPLGRSGPTLDNFLKMQSYRKGEMCPYGKKCTYGNKCKYNHPERIFPQKTVTERLVEHAQKQLQARNLDGKKIKGKSLSLPLQSPSEELRKKPLARTTSTTTNYTPEMDPDGFRGPFGARPDYREGENLHRKLRRELSVNPGCDPRIFHMQQQMHKHAAVTRHCSYQEPSNYLSTVGHSNVTRILSAPPPAHAPYALERHGAASEAQLWPTVDEERRKLRYHLAAIFPADQVDAALCRYPNETNAQKICAAILAMFPPKS